MAGSILSKKIAAVLLDSGAAWRKFQAICMLQGGMFYPPIAAFQHVVTARKAGKVIAIDNRHQEPHIIQIEEA